jgi:hypothetical protein
MPHHAHQRRPDDGVNTHSTADITRDGEEPPKRSPDLAIAACRVGSLAAI